MNLMQLLPHATNPDMLLLLFVAMVPPVGQDPFEEIINVHWGEGLAVEFEPGLT